MSGKTVTRWGDLEPLIREWYNERRNNKRRKRTLSFGLIKYTFHATFTVVYREISWIWKTEFTFKHDGEWSAGTKKKPVNSMIAIRVTHIKHVVNLNRNTVGPRFLSPRISVPGKFAALRNRWHPLQKTWNKFREYQRTALINWTMRKVRTIFTFSPQRRLPRCHSAHTQLVIQIETIAFRFLWVLKWFSKNRNSIA